MMGKVLFILICTAVFLFACVAEPENNVTAVSPVESGSLPDNTAEPDSSTETPGEPVYRKISAAEARRMMEATEDYILLDVRTESEFNEQRLVGAILIPDFEIADRAESELPDKDALILIYCRSGRRSANVTRELLDMGYTNVYDFGGILDWDYETING